MGGSELLARTTVYRGRIIQVELDVVKLPSGHTVDMEIIRHPGSVVLLPVPTPGSIILIRQYRYTIDKWIWELPAGSLKPGENPDEAAARECEEEIGLAPGKVTRLRGYFPTPGFCDEIMTYYRCEELRPPAADSTAKKDDDEDIEAKSFSRTDLTRMIAAGEIIDLKTIAGLAMVR